MKIMLNAREVEIGYSNLSYAEICKLVGYSSDTTLTVTYSRGRNQEHGSLIKGQFIVLSDGMCINAGMTNNA
jgi:hypothetical protein